MGGFSRRSMKLGLFGTPTDVNRSIYDNGRSIRLYHVDKDSPSPNSEVFNAASERTSNVAVININFSSPKKRLNYWCYRANAYVDVPVTRANKDPSGPQHAPKTPDSTVPSTSTWAVMFDNHIPSRQLRSPLALHRSAKTRIYLLRA